MTPTIMQTRRKVGNTAEAIFLKDVFDCSFYVNHKKSGRVFLFLDVKGNNLGSSTFISFECKLLIITFKI